MHLTLLRFGHLAVPIFGVLTGAGLMLALALSQRSARLVGVDPDRLWDAGLFALLAAFFCSRLLLVIEHFSIFRAHPILLLALPSLTPSGLLLAAISTWLWLRAKHLSVLRSLDAWAPGAALIWVFLALGHFAEGSDPGTPIHSGVPAAGVVQALYPVALTACGTAVLLTLAAYRGLQGSRRPGQTVGLTAFAGGITQFLLSFFRQPGVEMPLGLDELQWVALGLIAAGAVLLLVPSGTDR